ncbi:MAG: hypothetical protein HOC71_09355 [Candidatus Latescibacteria bacterium]|jgi:hypothetical protein|nr:hypothetical protein [Candidatus Latescibacterota bacterium]
MFTLHTIETKNSVTIPKNEFKQLIENLKNILEVEIILENDPDYLTDKELEQLQIAEKEFEKGETISADEYVASRFSGNMNV